MENIDIPFMDGDRQVIHFYFITGLTRIVIVLFLHDSWRNSVFDLSAHAHFLEAVTQR